MFEFARRDPNVPMGKTFELIQEEYIDTGKFGGISLSEVRAETIHEAVKHTKVATVELEPLLYVSQPKKGSTSYCVDHSRHSPYHRFLTDILENGIAAAYAQYEIPVITYSLTGRGMLTGKLRLKR
jgi:pyridoxine 4-dehydrogenase